MHVDEKSLVSGRLYWQCQLSGWLGFGLLQMSLGYATRARFTPMLVLAVVRSLGGLLATHLLRLWIVRRRWLHTVDRALAMRLLAGVGVAATGGGIAELFVTRIIPLNDPWRALEPLRFVQTWISWLFLLTGWTVLYVGIRELRERRAREIRALRLETQVQQAQLQGLRAQLNPHFLFNCLNSLREIIGDNPAARDMVTQLSTLLRYSLHSSQSELVPLEKELEVVRDYLSLETIRFEERLRVHWTVDPVAGAMQIPPMLLQTLVENALKHGVARRPQGDDVAVRVCVAGDELQLEVSNSGDVPDGWRSRGFGLANAQERISLLYGNRATLALENVSGGRVRALVRLPLFPVENANESAAR